MAPRSFALAISSVLLRSLAVAQQAPTPDNIQPLSTYTCTVAGGCVEQSTNVVFGWPYHWLHTVDGYDSCTTSSGGLNATLCGTAEDCFNNCEIAPGDYESLGITTSGDALTLYQYGNDSGTINSKSPNVMLLDSAGENYVNVQLLGQEFSFDVETSLMPCGENGALFLSEMDFTGGRSEYNPAGASYGFGGCSAQCGVSPYFNGEVNTEGLGACCNEMDLWEANSMATVFTPHPCSIEGIYGCTGDECGSNGVCNENGCGWNSYQQGDTTFYGPGLTIDTTKKFTVTTQFITNDGTTTGNLTEIRRYYTQDGVLYSNPVSTSYSDLNYIDDDFCSATDAFGGLAAQGAALGRGMVLIFSVWQDGSGFMNWLDSDIDNAGPCNSTEGNPSIIEANHPDTAITFSNIKWGELGSTSNAPGPDTGSSSSSSSSTQIAIPTQSSTASAPATTTTAATAPKQTQWGQCGGTGWTGPMSCVSPLKCVVQNPWYSQCLSN